MPYPSLCFQVEEHEIICTMRIDLPSGRRFQYHWRFDAGSKSHADLLAHQLEEQFSDAMLAAKAAAYERGYKDGRARRAKNPPVCADLDPNCL